MLRYLKISGLLLFVILTLSTLGLCAEEQITITTYYPSPYGVYKVLRLYPNDVRAENNCTDAGEITYSTIDKMLFCDGSKWKKLVSEVAPTVLSGNCTNAISCVGDYSGMHCTYRCMANPPFNCTNGEVAYTPQTTSCACPSGYTRVPMYATSSGGAAGSSSSMIFTCYKNP